MRAALLFVQLGLLQAALSLPEQKLKSNRQRKLEEDLRDQIMHDYETHIDKADRQATVRRNPEELDPNYWADEANRGLEERLRRIPNTNIAKNVIFFLGDGMSIPTLMAARTYQGQLEGKPGEEGELYWEKFPYTGLSKTWCLDKQVPDSACTSTAYLTGVKTNIGTLGINGNVVRGDCRSQLNESNHVDSILAWGLDQGKSAGIVTTTRVTHASPAGGYAHVAERHWESDTDVINSGADPELCLDIARQLVTREPGMHFNVIMGGGRREFLGKHIIDEEGTRGDRTDGRDLIYEWEKDKRERGASYIYSWHRDSLLEISRNPDKYDYVLGLYEDSHLVYHLDASPITEPTLAEMTEAAIKVLSKNEEGYVLFVEGGRIDHAHHETWAKLALDETVEFAKAVQVGTEMTSTDDTLIVVTSDHAHTMTISGYPDRGNPIGGKSNTLAADKLKYMTLGYANGPGYRKPDKNGQRHNIDRDDTEALHYRYPGAVPLNAETHGGDDVAIFATGPWSHLFTGTMEQSNIPHFMGFASCLRPYSVTDEYL